MPVVHQMQYMYLLYFLLIKYIYILNLVIGPFRSPYYHVRLYPFKKKRKKQLYMRLNMCVKGGARVLHAYV
jgi:hypothetical protein